SNAHPRERRSASDLPQEASRACRGRIDLSRAGHPLPPVRQKNDTPRWRESQSLRCHSRPEQIATANRIATPCPFPFPACCRESPQREILPDIQRACARLQTQSTRCHLSGSRKTGRTHKCPGGEKPPVGESTCCLQ